MKKIYLNNTEFAPELRLDTVVSFEENEIPDYVKSINRPLSGNEEMTFECDIDPRLFGARTGVDLSRFPDNTSGFTLEFQSPYLVQIRRHRKKRINKKWAKRYGHKTMFKSVRFTECSLISEQDGDEFFALTDEPDYWR